MKLRTFMFLTLLGLSTSTFADNPPAGEPPPDDHKVIAPAPMGMGGAAPVMFRAGGIGTIGFIAYDLWSLGVAYLPIEHMMVAAAVTFQYNGNGGVFVGPPNRPAFDAFDKFESGILVAAEYMIKDAMPFAMGPALAIRTNFAPISAGVLGPTGVDAFGMWVIMPAWDLWYTPFNAPMAIGAALGINITLTQGYEPVISFATPAMRLAYTF